MKNVVLSLLLVLASASVAQATAFTPCQSGTVASIFNTTCTVGNLVFAFGEPFPVDNNVDPTQITFTPLTDGFALGGLNEKTPTLFGPFLFLSLPVLLSSLDGEPTITGLTTSIVGGSFTGGASAFSFFEQCDATNPLHTVGAIAEQTATLAFNPASVSFPPVSSFQACGTGVGEQLFLTEGTGSFTSATYEVQQVVPEPATALLMIAGIGLIAMGGGFEVPGPSSSAESKE
jgi:hypothetical protein